MARRSVPARLIGLALIAASFASGAVEAHPGHAAPVIEITRPAARALYFNDVRQDGEVLRYGEILNPAVSMGAALTVRVDWVCPPASTGALVRVVARNGDGAQAWNSGLLAGPATGNHSFVWAHGVSGTYTLHATLDCGHFETDMRGATVRVGDGNDEDERTVIAIV